MKGEDGGEEEEEAVTETEEEGHGAAGPGDAEGTEKGEEATSLPRLVAWSAHKR